MDDAEQKAGETDGSMRIFKKRGDANTFVREKKREIRGENVNVVTPPRVARRTSSNNIPDGSDVAVTGGLDGNSGDITKLGNDELKEMFKKKMLDKAGNKIIANYLAIPGKNDVIVVIDFCRETRDTDGNIVRKVSAHIIQCFVGFLLLY